VIKDDAFGHGTCPALCSLCSLVWVVIKWVLLRKCIGKFHSFLLVVPIEGLFISLCMAF